MKRSTDRKFYVTTGTATKKDGTTYRWQYRTKSLTPKHAALRVEYADAQTIMYDPSVEWPFGTYAEVVGDSLKNIARHAAQRAGMGTWSSALKLTPTERAAYREKVKAEAYTAAMARALAEAKALAGMRE